VGLITPPFVKGGANEAHSVVDDPSCDACGCDGPLGVAQAKPISDSADAQCAKLAIKTLGSSFNPSNYTFHGGSDVIDTFDVQATEGNDVFCGFGGDDRIDTLEAGDIFLGGAGDDFVLNTTGTFNGGDGIDTVGINNGTFNGGEGNDTVLRSNTGTTTNVEVLPTNP
jgi:hypothetical protein